MSSASNSDLTNPQTEESKAPGQNLNLEDPKQPLDYEGGKEEFVNKVMKQIRMFLALKYCKTDSIPSEVTPGLYIGSIGAAMSKSVLLDIGITHILCVADSINPIFPTEFTYKLVKILDSPEVRIVDHLTECFKFIEEGQTNGKVLVHCFAGKSRSSSVVIAYMMKVNLWSYDQAYEFLKIKRAIIEPNIGFVGQLRELNFR